MWIVLNYLSREYTEFGCNEIGRNTIYMQELGKRKKERKKERKRERERKKEREKERKKERETIWPRSVPHLHNSPSSRDARSSSLITGCHLALVICTRLNVFIFSLIEQFIFEALLHLSIQRTLTIGGRIFVQRLFSILARLYSTSFLHTNNNIVTSLIQSSKTTDQPSSKPSTHRECSLIYFTELR